MIEFGLARYLKEQTTVTSHVGRDIFLARRPKNTKTSGTSDNDIEAIRQPNLLARGRSARSEPNRSRRHLGQGCERRTGSISCLRSHPQTISSFRGMWGDYEVLGCTYLNESFDADAITDGSDHWDFVYGFDLQIHHLQEGTLLSEAPPAFVLRLHRLANGRVILLSTSRVHAINRPVGS